MMGGECMATIFRSTNELRSEGRDSVVIQSEFKAKPAGLAREMVAFAKDTARRVVARLIACGWVQRTGKGRAAVYVWTGGSQ